jgi:hypothetical protein
MTSTSKRKANWDLDRLDGEAAEHMLAQLLKESNIEVKHDKQAMKTGRVFIETECEYKTGWGPSGINVTEAEAWAFILDLEKNITITIKTEWLVSLVAMYRDQRPLYMENEEGHATKGIGVPLNAIIRGWPE